MDNKPTKRILTKKMKDFLKILEKNRALITKSCGKANIARSTYYKWLNENPKFAEELESAKEKVKDFGEDALYELIKEKNPAAVIFYNKCINRDRGYNEKQEIELSGSITKKDDPETIKLIHKLPDKLREKLMKL